MGNNNRDDYRRAVDVLEQEGFEVLYERFKSFPDDDEFEVRFDLRPVGGDTDGENETTHATAEEIEEWDEEHDEPHPVFNVDHRPEREPVMKKPDQGRNDNDWVLDSVIEKARDTGDTVGSGTWLASPVEGKDRIDVYRYDHAVDTDPDGGDR